MSKTLVIREMWRNPTGTGDRMTLQPGVNVIVGPPNTGKTRWLETLDFVMGDDSKAEEKLGEDLFDKYESASVRMAIGENEFVISRRWRELGTKTKVFVDDEAKSLVEFQEWLLRALGIPEVNFPQGDPYGGRAWPTLRFRSLLRHMYRRQRLWDDFADRQPESEQHACLMQFLGLAEVLFSDTYAEMVRKQKKVQELEARRESYLNILTEITADLVGESIPGLAVTPNGLTDAIADLERQVKALLDERDGLVRETIQSTATQDTTTADHVDDLSTQLVELRSRLEDVAARTNANRRRVAELQQFRGLADSELGRLTRAKSSSDVLSPLRVTNCPVCDQPIADPSIAADICYLCRTPLDISGAEKEQRVSFEIEQLKAENREVDDLLTTLGKDDAALAKEHRNTTHQLAAIERQLQPTRRSVIAVLPPQVLDLDRQIGTLQERGDQLQRIYRSLLKREQIALEAQEIRQRVATLEAEVAQLAASIDFETAADHMADAMNDYVRKLMIDGGPAWTQSAISWTLKERAFVVRVGRVNWRAQLGGTLSLYFILAYHYALLTLVRYPGCHYPGISILDFPAEIEGTSVADKENFVVVPFVQMLTGEDFKESQMIAAGSAFEGLEGAHRIELTHVWK